MAVAAGAPSGASTYMLCHGVVGITTMTGSDCTCCSMRVRRIQSVWSSPIPWSR